MISYAKKPPQNTDIEESLLAACIMSPEMCEAVQDALVPDDFYATQHQHLFSAISDMRRAEITVDAATVADWMNSHNLAERIGGAGKIGNLLDVPIPASIDVYCDRLKRYAQLRKIATICGSTLQECYAGKIDDIDSIISNFQTQALMAGDDLSAKFVTKIELTDESIDRYEALKKNNTSAAIPTGFNILDRVTGGGFRGSKLVIIAARPRVGKTALMCNMAANMCNAGYGVGVFSLEMDRSELDDRWIAAGAKINSLVLTKEPGPNASEWEKITYAAGVQYGWNLLIDDRQADIHQLKRRIKQMIKQGVQVILIDQLSGISGNRNKSAWERNTEHVEELKLLKKEIRTPIVLLAQLNRDLEKRDNKKPRLSDLKNTGQLEEDADIVLLGHRPWLYAKEESGAEDTTAEWEVAKNRQGVEWNIAMDWNGKYQQFTEKT